MRRVERAVIGVVTMGVVGGGLLYTAYLDKKKSDNLVQKAPDRLFTGFGLADVNEVELVAGGTDFHFIVRDSHWWLTRPIEWRADDKAVDRAIQNMIGIKTMGRIQGALTDRQRQEFGLTEPQVKMALLLKDGTRHTLEVGERIPQDPPTFAVIADGKDFIEHAHADFYDDVSRDLYAYRDKQVFRLEDQTTRAITVKKKGQLVYHLERKDDGWLVHGASGPPRPADPAMVDGFILILNRDLKAQAFATDDYDRLEEAAKRRLGLSPPAFTIDVHGPDGSLVSRVGAAPGDGQLPEGPFFRRMDSPFVAEVYEHFVTDIDKTAADFRDRTLARFSPDDVFKIELVLGGGERAVVQRDIVAEKAEESTWRITEPANRAAKPWKVQQLLKSFARLRSARVERDDPTKSDLRGWLLEPPERRAVFYDQAGAVLADVRVGKPIDGSHLFVTAAGLTRVDAISSAQIERALPTDLADLTGS